ncbi:hypothetical protein [Anoxybacteroides rupiense]|jgi:hypothetical protein|uniref:hypothetical protein n=1 Tax=Anoxybacteroides rupiense TaxID=311460 RepID=UPI001605F9EB|nr:hypothetical protein [Anoxybacillus rupiensis]MBB3909375.1 hypothetical protein [Anoxybacillus rupiensis]
MFDDKVRNLHIYQKELFDRFKNDKISDLDFEQMEREFVKHVERLEWDGGNKDGGAFADFENNEMSDYEKELTNRLRNKQISNSEFEQIEREFIEYIEKLGFVPAPSLLDDEDREYGYNIFRYKFEEGIYLLLNTEKEYDEEYDYTSWGKWYICNECRDFLCYYSKDEKLNIVTMNGFMTACFGFWMEGVEAIPSFITKYLKYKTRKE